MAVVRKAVFGDFDKVYGLILLLPAQRVPKEEWKKLFLRHWDQREEWIGYVLEDGEDIVGFLGTIFSKRILGGKPVDYCNLTTWVVREEYRRESMNLILQLLDLREHVMTAFSAMDRVALILKKIGFSELGIGRKVILPLPTFSTLAKSLEYRVFSDPAHIEKNLQGEELKIFKDHLPFKCSHFLIMGSERKCYLVLSRVMKKGLPFAQLQYIGDIGVFADSIDFARFQILARMAAVGMVVEERLLKGSVPRRTFDYPLPSPCPQLYKGEGLSPMEIDNLYSDHIILNF